MRGFIFSFELLLGTYTFFLTTAFLYIFLFLLLPFSFFSYFQVHSSLIFQSNSFPISILIHLLFNFFSSILFSLLPFVTFPWVLSFFSFLFHMLLIVLFLFHICISVLIYFLYEPLLIHIFLNFFFAIVHKEFPVFLPYPSSYIEHSTKLIVCHPSPFFFSTSKLSTSHAFFLQPPYRLRSYVYFSSSSFTFSV